MRTGMVMLGTGVFVAGVTVGVGLTGRLPSRSAPEGAAVAPRPPVQIGSPAAGPPAVGAPAAGATAYPDFTTVAQNTIPAVTNISSRQVVRRRSRRSSTTRSSVASLVTLDAIADTGSVRALESGVIVSEDGYVLTNAHVVGAQTAGITVTLSDNREFEADLIGRDESTDIALLRIDADDLPTIPWGSSSTLRVAEWVLAVGNPFQLNQTVTLGIVSAVGRDNLGVAQYEDFIQTDAAINPGNSGGRARQPPGRAGRDQHGHPERQRGVSGRGGSPCPATSPIASWATSSSTGKSAGDPSASSTCAT